MYKTNNKIHRNLCILPFEIAQKTVYNINRTKESEVKTMPKFPNEYDPDNTDGAELLKYAAALLNEINGKEDEV